MRYLSFLLCLPLGGCLFFMFPVPNVTTWSANACVQQGVSLGQKVGPNKDGKYGEIKQIYGSSARCNSDPQKPILVQVDYAT